jgi:hypothetical protein
MGIIFVWLFAAFVSPLVVAVVVVLVVVVVVVVVPVVPVAAVAVPALGAGVAALFVVVGKVSAKIV